MPEKKTVERITFQEEFFQCPKCGYDKGFHSVFVRGTENGDMQWILTCPSCAARFDAGLTVVPKRGKGPH